MAVSRPQSTPQMTAWVARIPLDQVQALAMLRGEADLMVLEDASYCWIRDASASTPLSEKLAERLQWLAVAELFHVTTAGTIIPWGKRVPTEQAPSGSWQPLSKFMTPHAPVARYAARCPEPAVLYIVPSEDIVTPTLLRLPLSEWRAYVATAPNLRLTRWEFAASQAGEVLVRGTPLPSLPGQRYWEADGLLMPCGWMWSPAVAVEIVRRVLQLEAGECALADWSTSTWEIIPHEAFVPARRQNVRGTMMAQSLPSEDAP